MGGFSGQQFSGQQFSGLGQTLASGAKAVGQGALGNIRTAYNRYKNLVNPTKYGPTATDPTGLNVPVNPYNNGLNSIVPVPTQVSDEGQSDPTQGGGDTMNPPQPLAQGKLVTRPTIALLGDQGPEKIVPLNANPNNKVNPPNPYPRMR